MTAAVMSQDAEAFEDLTVAMTRLMAVAVAAEKPSDADTEDALAAAMELAVLEAMGAWATLAASPTALPLLQAALESPAEVAA